MKLLGFSTLWNYTTLKLTCVGWYFRLRFQYLMKLHYSQTSIITRASEKSFQYLMKLHYSQTVERTKSQELLFQYLMKLHYSQTRLKALSKRVCFSTLWNYTTLKPNCVIVFMRLGFSTLWNYTTLKLVFVRTSRKSVSVPYEITLLSNPTIVADVTANVSVPYEITLLSNQLRYSVRNIRFQYLMKLHYSQTIYIFAL